MRNHQRALGSNSNQVLAVICVAFILLIWLYSFDGGGRGRELPHQKTCLSHIHQLATACLMYSQDHQGRFPGVEWVKEIMPYVRHERNIFTCPSDDNNAVGQVNYGYNGLLVLPDGSGVIAKDITMPSEVGMLCDASPSKSLPVGGLINGGALQPVGSIVVIPFQRHSGGTIMEYADGHARWISFMKNLKHFSDCFSHAFYKASALGLIDNPAGGICGFGNIKTVADPISIGGEPCTAAILRAATGVWAEKTHAPVTNAGFYGQYAVNKPGADYLWGTGDGVKPTGHSIPIGRDALVLIAAKHTAIERELREGKIDDIPVIDKPSIQHAFRSGRLSSLQTYTFDGNSGTSRFFCARMGQPGKPLQISNKSIVVTDDFTMVDKVAHDPYGIGYCSSAIADQNRVQLLNFITPDGVVHSFPQNKQEYRTMHVEKSELQLLLEEQKFDIQNYDWLQVKNPPWPLTRTLYAQYGGKAWNAAGTGIVNVMLKPGAPGTKALQDGPLYQASYYMP